MFAQTFGINHCNNNDLLQNTAIDVDRNYAELFNDLDLVSRFCLPICCRDNEIREVALDVISKTVEGWLDGVGSPKHSNFSSENSLKQFTSDNMNDCCKTDKQNGASEFNGVSVVNQSVISNIPKEYMDLVALHLPIILRLSINCPFSNVREKCKQILKIVRDRGLPVPYPVKNGPSAYINSRELLSWDTQNDKEFYLAANIPVAHSSDEPTEARPPIFFDTTPTNDMGQIGHGTHTLFIDAFLQNNRLDHVSQVMGLHPSYLNHFLKTQYFILRGDGPLPYDYRHYIAIMAAGRHQCSYLISLQKQEFLLQGGDPTWLKGLPYIPRKLRNLYEINKILGHRPWLLNKSHIEKLTKGGPDSWSLAEVVHAIVILAHFHSLSSFVFSCGVNEEVDQAGGHAYQASNPTPDDDSIAISECTTSNSISRSQSQQIVALNNIRQEQVATCLGRSPPEPEVGIVTLMARMKTLSERTEECTQTELTKRFENVESQSAELGAVPEPITEVAADISQFIDDPNFLYQDFARRGEISDIPTFRVQDYSWDDHGYSLVNRLYNDVGYLLDDKFKTAYNLTYYTMGGRRDVDTSRFRRAIWNYIQCMFGIRHDDYDYGEVNHLLERSLKTFIKSACCYPERVTKKDYDRVLREFEHSEKVHVNLMVLESRMQAELLYALKAVMRYMT